MALLAINGGKPLHTSLIGKWPNFYPEDIQNLQDVLYSRVWGGIPFPGKYTSLCTAYVKETMNCKHAVLVTNGSDALVISLKAIGIIPGDEVITTGYTWIATAGSILRCNAIPIFVDITPNTICIDPNLIEASITKKTKAIVIVHIANQVCDMDSVLAIARKHNLWVIEDCAHAPYAEWRGKKVGTIGDIGTFSFEQSKIITCGEGGMVITNSDELYEKISSYTNCGRKNNTDDEYYGNMLGWNHRLSEFQAAILFGQLQHIKEWMTHLDEQVLYLFEQIRQRSAYLRPLMEENKYITRRQHYSVLLYYSNGELPLSLFCKAVRMEGAELEDNWYPAMNDNPLFHVTSQEWPFIQTIYGDSISSSSFNLSICRDLANNHLVWIHYPSYSVSHEQINNFVDCIVKVEKNITELVEKT